MTEDLLDSDVGESENFRIALNQRLRYIVIVTVFCAHTKELHT